MKTLKKIGIWMDHTMAHITEFDSEIHETKIITSDFSFQDKVDTLQRSESGMHNKEQQKLSTYYNELAQIIKNFDEVILFGPTDAKVELYNELKNNHQFDAIKIEVSNTDKMSEKEQRNFIDDYF
jgi:stalled ribosome rescue protein Dom34